VTLSSYLDIKAKPPFDEGIIRRRHQVAQNLGTLPFKFTVQHAEPQQHSES
jgi:hypothetical protein